MAKKIEARILKLESVTEKAYAVDMPTEIWIESPGSHPVRAMLWRHPDLSQQAAPEESKCDPESL